MGSGRCDTQESSGIPRRTGLVPNGRPDFSGVERLALTQREFPPPEPVAKSLVFPKFILFFEISSNIPRSTFLFLYRNCFCCSTLSNFFPTFFISLNFLYFSPGASTISVWCKKHFEKLITTKLKCQSCWLECFN
jgi:hypothetical protein